MWQVMPSVRFTWSAKKAVVLNRNWRNPPMPRQVLQKTVKVQRVIQLRVQVFAGMQKTNDDVSCPDLKARLLLSDHS